MAVKLVKITTEWIKEHKIISDLVTKSHSKYWPWDKLEMLTQINEYEQKHQFSMI